jgi:predicted alpha/beta-hydrolase family hydrolase
MTSSTRPISDASADPPLRGFLHSPESPNGRGLVLTHGAGANCRSALLIALGEAFAGAGFTVLRCDLPFRQVRLYGPPGPGDGARDRAGLKNAAEWLRTQSAGHIFFAGHSYGGRQASMLCAEQPELAAGLLLLSYPLHPPRKPEQLRTQHLPKLQAPVLFVHGTHDPFGTIDEMQSALRMIPAKTKLFPVEGAGHDLGFKGKERAEELPGVVVAGFREFLGK